MGVPKFYRWISERYPCLSEVVKEYQIPEFDNLYLDMNGVVHTCSHPEDDNPHFRITEEKIMEDIFHYIEVLFRMIKPRKVFFMAIDGVAPRAKMNQQRGRRFRSAREAENLVKKALEKGEVMPTEARFDSNCITPGTEFMNKLHEQLQYFVVKKTSTDRLWQGVRVYLSGHETPGEGEHKVMDFIRHEKSQPGYDSNTRHCLYGLDADLIMLGLITHEPHFSLLREEVRFGKQNQQKRSTAAEDTTFHLLHLSLMREYLDFEFSGLKNKLPFGYDLECIIDDWVLMGFLVGNDFIPHLPDLHIHHDALPLLWKTYKKVLPSLNGYLHDGGHLNLDNFEKYLRVVSKIDFDNFGDKHADIKWLENRRESRDAKKHHALTSDEAGIPTAKEFMLQGDEDPDNSLAALSKEDFESMMAEFDFSDEEDSDEEEPTSYDEQFFTDFRNFKNSYYKTKLEYSSVTQEVLKEQAVCYVRAIQWILYYYYDGVQSWSWYYPHHYAPYVSDVRNFSDIKLEYDYGKPFLPFQQLMAVLPAASKNLMPVPLQYLMLSDNSPVIDYYPIDFETDLNGKQQEWEAVVLIPFINENRLISAMRPIEAKLTDEEKARNRHGPHLMFQYTPEVQGTYTSAMFPDIVNHHTQLTLIPKDTFWTMDRTKLKKGLCPGVKQNVYFPGFPTMAHIPHTAKLQKSGVKVFTHQSRGENMMLTITKQNQLSMAELAKNMIGKSIYVAWPHLSEARVNAISDGTTKYYWVNKMSKSKPSSHKEKVQVESAQLDPDEVAIWQKELSVITEEYRFRKGVFVGNTDVLVYSSSLAGNRYVCGHHGDVILEKQWSSSSHAHVLQSTVMDIAVKDSSFKQYKTLDALFSVKSEVFMLGQPHYGCMGEVLSVDPANEGRIRVDFTILQEPDLNKVQDHKERYQTKYFPSYSLARRVGISGFMLSRITGCIFVTKGSPDKKGRPDKVNVGFNLKLNKSQQEIPGYTKKVETEWLYSDAVGQLIQDYIERYPELFSYISQGSNESAYYSDDIFEGDSVKKLQELLKYIKELPCSSVPPVPHGSCVLEESMISAIEAEVSRAQEMNKKKKKHIKMQVRPHLLYRPLEAQINLVADPSTTYALYDRIINIRDGFSVPLGLRGTITGITNAEKECDVMYDVVFDEPFLGGQTLRCSPGHGYRMPMTAMINLTHGERKAQGTANPMAKPTAVVKPQSTYNSVAPPPSYARATTSHQGNSQQDHHNQGRHRDNQFGNRNNDSYGNRQQEGNRNPPRQTQSWKQSSGAQEEFNDMWNQLQNTHLTSPKKPANGPQGQKSGEKRGQSATQGGPSLQQAANFLKKSSFQGPTPAEAKKKSQSESGKPAPATDSSIKIMKSQGQLNKDSTQPPANQDDNEFTAILQSLQEDPEQPAKPNMGAQFLHDGTAVLCQMLNITPECSASKDVSGNEPSNQKKFGQQLSVEELFSGAKQQKPQVPMSDILENKSPNKQERALSAVEELSEWCRRMAEPQPEYEYQNGRDNKQKAVITLADGRVFHGSYARNPSQAAESAAGMVMLHLNTDHNERFGFPCGPEHGPVHPQQGPRHLSTSPNSAFTPVRPPTRAPPQAMPMGMNQHQPFAPWGPRGPPFPPPPFGHPAQGHFHQQRFPPQHQMHGQGPRTQKVPFHPGPGFFPQPNMDGPPLPFGFPQHWPNTRMQQRGPRSQPSLNQTQQTWLQQQHHQQQYPPGRGHGSGQVGQGMNQTGQGSSQQGQASHIDQGASSSANTNKGETPKKANQFIPFQVTQKQKTPNRETRKDDTENSDQESSTQQKESVVRTLDLDPGKNLLQVLTSGSTEPVQIVPPGKSEQQPVNMESQPAKCPLTCQNIEKNIENQHNPATDKPVIKGAKKESSTTSRTPSKSKDDQAQNNITHSVTPGKKAKCRLAANFSALK